MSFFAPDKYLYRISDIDIQKDILDKKFKYLLLDVDNTILTRDNSVVPNDVSNWLQSAQNLGLKICLISNDWHSNVKDLSKDINLPIVVKSLKPLPPAYFKAMKKIGADKSHTLMIGDQLMTDVFGAHSVGIQCYLVKPLVKKDLIHTLILRKVENIFLKGKVPEGRTREF